MKARVAVFSDYICPFCFVGKELLDRAEEELTQMGVKLEVDWKAFELRPEGANVPEKSKEYLDGAWENIYLLSREYGVEIRRPSSRTNSNLTFHAAEYAKDQGKFRQFHDKAFRDYFLNSIDIGSIDYLLKLGDELGLNHDELGKAIGGRRYKDRIEEDRKLAEAYMVTGVPTFTTETRIIVGAQPYEILMSTIAETITT